MNTTTETTHAPRAYHDAISQRAREIWHARGCPDNQSVEIWLEAERELVSAGKIPPAPPAAAAPTTGAAKTTRGRRKTSGHINPEEVREHIDTYGQPPARSPTAIDPTTSP